MNIAILGNSITFHGVKEDIGWYGSCGMAASSEDKDYSHILVKNLKEKGLDFKYLIKNIADFEREYNSYDVKKEYKDIIDFNADVIIMCIAENVEALDTEEKKANFKAAYLNLFNEIDKDKKATIFIRSSFWADENKDGTLKEACDILGGYFVDISSLCKDEANFARSEREFENPDVANHPGDTGMANIAKLIWEKVDTVL